MKNFWLAAMLVALFCGPVRAGDDAGPDLESQAGKQGYSIGYQLGQDFKVKNIQVDIEAMAAGVKAGIEGVDPALGIDEVHNVISSLQKKVEEEKRAQYLKVAEQSKKDGEKFLDENSTKEGVVVLPSGLQYKVINEGDGPKPTATSKVTVHYRGTLPDGTEFDSSYKRGEPATFPVNRVIAGWTEALQLMPVGSKWMLYIPSALAYGQQGAPPRFGPNQVLIFEVELLGME